MNANQPHRMSVEETMAQANAARAKAREFCKRKSMSFRKSFALGSVGAVVLMVAATVASVALKR